MEELVKCKACGFVMKKSKLRDKCPACAALAKVFEPYTERISPMRKLILSMDIHPVMVHFPQAFTVTIIVLAAASIFIGGVVQEKFTATLLVLGIALPFTILSAFFAGMLDGKIRFRKISTPILIQKIFLGSVFFILSCAISYVLISQPITSTTTLSLVIVFGLLGLVCSSILGILGVSILNSKFPG